ncbi:MAG: hypothetical protein Q4G03_10935 [Planctomycetia bacterium]|nr:hypothetical protein [Planctomycetia bacterium]
MCAKAKEDKAAKAERKAREKEEKAQRSAEAKQKKGAKSKKKKSSSSSEYGFLLLHGEKVGIAVAVLLFGGLLAMGSGLKPFTITADEISQSASRADETIKNSKVTPKEYDEAVDVFQYDKYAELIKSSVKVNMYETPVRWEQSLFPDKTKRPSIKPLPLENLRARACIGAIMYNEISASNTGAGAGMGGGIGAGAMGAAGMGGMSGGMGGNGGELKGRQWITVTGSIPIRKQQTAYNDAFGDAQYLDDTRDQPRYVYYKLERGVVSASGSIDWKPIDVIRAIKRENNLWSGVGSDQVGYNYLAPTVSNFPPMAMSPPPMANKPFGEEIANLPNIPLNSTEQIAIQSDELKEWAQLQDAMSQMSEDELLSRDPFADVAAGGSRMSAGLGMNMSMDAGMGGSSGIGVGMGAGVDGVGGAGNSWLVNQNAINASRMRIQQATTVDYYLFRFFDFEVEPDTTYVYRVKLILANPNYGVEERFVEDPATLEQRFIESDFSDPSNPVALGADARVFAETVEAPARAGSEPVIALSSIYFDAESASESIVKGQRLRRGAVANFYNQSHNPINVQGGMSADMMMGNATGKGKSKNNKKSVNHVSDETVADALGGVKISGSDYRSPGKILLLEPNGLLQIREVKEDARELSRYDDSNTGGMMGGGMMGGGMMM